MSDLEGKSILELKVLCEERGILVDSKDSKVRLIAKLKKHETEMLSAKEQPPLEDGTSKAVLLEPGEPLSKHMSFEEQRELLDLNHTYQKEMFEMRDRERLRNLEIEMKKLEIEEKRLELELKRKEFVPLKTNSSNSENRSHFFKVRDMKDDEDIEDYFQIFEMAANALNVDKKDWVGNLCHRLNDKCRSVFLELSETEVKCYEVVRDKILEAHQLTADYYRHKFRTTSKQANEDFSLWAKRTQRYFNQWMRATKSEGDVDKISEQMAIEQLLGSVSSDLQIWLKDRQVTSVDEFGQLANEYVEARKGPKIDGKFVGKKQRNFKPKSQDENLSVFADVRPEASSSGMNDVRKQDNSSKPKKPLESVKCFNCSEFGHFANSCPKPDRRKLGTKGSAQGYLCLKPVDGEHKTSPFVLEGKINYDEARLLVDSGCSRTLVHRMFVQPDSETGQLMSVLLVNGDSITIPLANVDIETKHGVQRELVGVLDDLPVDCLLGRSSFGRSFGREDLLMHWECEDLDSEILHSEDAFFVTRSQSALNAAQERRDKLVDRENKIVQEMMVKEELNTPKHSSSVNLNDLFVDSPSQDDRPDEVEPVQVQNHESELFSGFPSEFRNVLALNKAQLIRSQKKDPTLKSLSIKDKLSTQEEGFFLNKNVLMHRKLFPDHIDQFCDRVVVPQFLRQEILRIAHTIPVAGHMGIEKTRHRIERHFFWPGFYSDIRTFCATCPECQLVARKRTSERSPLKPVPIVSEPFAKVAIDLIGELPRSSSGYKYILTLVDYATRYPEAIPLRSTFSKTVADALILIFTRVGIPKELVSDQGSNFISELMKHFYNEFGIVKIQTSVYHPEGNGLVERFNGTLKAMLRKLAANDISHWDKYLPFLLFAYREVPSASTGFSPFELLYARPIRGPLALVKESWIEDNPKETSVVGHVLKMRERMSRMKDLVHEISKKATRNKSLGTIRNLLLESFRLVIKSLFFYQLLVVS